MTASFASNGDGGRLTAKLRAARVAPTSAQTSSAILAPLHEQNGGPHDPRTRRKLNDLYSHALTEGFPPDRDTFLIIVGRALADIHPDPTLGPALTLTNLIVLEHALFDEQAPHLPGYGGIRP